MPSRTTWNILVPTFAVSGLLLLVGVGGAVYVHRASRDISDSLHAKLAAEQSAQRIVLAIREMRLELIRIVNTRDADSLNEAITLLKHVEDQLALDSSSVAWDSGRLAYEDFRKRFEQLLSDHPADEQQQITAELIRMANTTLLAPAEKLSADRQQLAIAASRQNQAVARRLGVGLLLLGVCGAAAGLLIGFSIARSVHRSMIQISVPVRDMAGQLNEVLGPIQISTDTEVFPLDNSLRMLADKTADVVRQLQESQQQAILHEQLAAVGQLAAGLAHELRNPLMSVKLIVQTAAERGERGLSARDLAVIEDEVTRLERLLQSFLDFARPPQPKKEAVDVVEVVEKTIGVIRLRALEQDVHIQWSAADQRAMVEADESQLRQVMLNLLLNALDVLPGGGNVWIDIDAPPTLHHGAPTATAAATAKLDEKSQDNRRTQLVVRIADDGPGLSEEVADRVFEPFVSTKETGIGLGLSICRQIVESHDGRIFAGNGPHGGAEFRILLPRAVNEPADGDVPAHVLTISSVDAH